MPDMNPVDRRRDNVFLNVITPIVSGVVAGVGVGYVAVMVTISLHGARLDYVERDMADFKVFAKEMSQANIEAAKRTEWIRATEKTIDALIRSNKLIESNTRDRYTKTEADIDNARQDHRIDRLESYHK